MKEIVITSSVLILVLVLMRAVLKGRISLRLQYALWALVLVRLLLPFSLSSSPVSVMNFVDRADAGLEASASDGTFTEANADANGQTDTATMATGNTPVSQTDVPVGKSPSIDWTTAAVYVWYVGMAAVGAVLLISNISFALKLRRTRRPYETDGSPLPVYVSKALPTPCMFGLFRPAIYVTPDVLENDAKLRHVLAHESAHYRHGDHLWSALRGLCLAAYWFDPLVWLAASLSRRDAELACDEGAIARIGENERIEYGRTLIGLTCTRSRTMDLLCCATTMTGTKRSITERIKMIAKRPKTAAYTLIAVILIAALTAGCTFTGADKSDASPKPSGEQSDEQGTVMDGIDVPEEVLAAAKKYVAEAFDEENESVTQTENGLVVVSPVYNYLEWRITDLEKTYTYDMTDGNDLDVYRMNYEFKVDDPEKVPLAGGMYITDGNWVCPTYPNATFLIFDASDNTHLFTMMENDCVPGSDTFTADLLRRLSQAEGSETGLSIVLPISVQEAALKGKSEKVDLSMIAVTELDKEATFGAALIFDYASDEIVIFHGYFGLYVYDLKEQKMLLTVDFEKAVGTTVIQGSYGAAVCVSAGGKQIRINYYPDQGSPRTAYYIDIAEQSCTYGPYKELDSTFVVPNGSVKFADGTEGTVKCPTGKIESICYIRDDMVYEMFDNFLT